MEKFDLIRSRSFGDKLNELTSLIYENFMPFLRKSWWLVLSSGVLIALIVKYFPTETPAECWAYFLLLSFLVLLLVILFVVLFRLVAIEQQHIDSRRSFFVQALVLGGRALPTMLLPLAVLCLFGGSAVSFINENNSNNIFAASFFILLFMLLHIVISVPLFLLVNVCVLEERYGFAALKRVYRLLKYRIFSALLFYLIVMVLFLTLPYIADLPYMIYYTLRDIVTDEFGTRQPDSFGVQLIDLIFTTLGVCVLLFDICMASLATLLEYGNAVEVVDNVRFLEKFNNFDNL